MFLCHQLAEEENEQRRRQEQMLLEKLEQEEQQEEEEETKVSDSDLWPLGLIWFILGLEVWIES